MSLSIPTFDELLNNILTDYRNLQGTVSAESQIRSACLASAIWGLYKMLEYTSKQAFADSADAENLDHHAWVRGLTRNDGESDSSLLSRLLAVIRNPPAGGNANDYIVWAREIDNVAAAYCYPLAMGLGSVDVVIVADISTGSEIPTADLLAEVLAHINAVRPVAASQVRVLAPSILSQAVNIAVTGADADKTQIEADITALLSAMAPDQTLYKAQLTAIALANGADNAVVTVPAADVVPAAHQMIRPGVITIT